MTFHVNISLSTTPAIQAQVVDWLPGASVAELLLALWSLSFLHVKVPNEPCEFQTGQDTPALACASTFTS